MYTDLGGAIFSYLQLFIDSANDGHVNIFKGGLNIGKFALSVLSIVFDVTFISQHHYYERKAKMKYNVETEKAPLLNNTPQISNISSSDL